MNISKGIVSCIKPKDTCVSFPPLKTSSHPDLHIYIFGITPIPFLLIIIKIAQFSRALTTNQACVKHLANLCPHFSFIIILSGK